MSRTILIVDDDPVQRRLLEAAVTRLGHAARVASDAAEALAMLAAEGEGGVDLMLLDLVMPGMDGIGMLQRLGERGATMPVIVQTANGGIDAAVRAMRAGASDFVVKPVSPEKLQAVIKAAFKVEARREIARRRDFAHGLGEIVGTSEAMERVMALARKAARSMIPIMIEGESGVGKEMVARAIQGAGERSGAPFVTVNCGAIPENLVESILFGHEKGSFTGAGERHPGKFAEADGGTLFLDEVGELPLDIQVKLLRAVQQGEIDPVGARATLKVDVRLISATNRDLQARLREGLFREDLFYRLNVFPILVPPLRARREDIAALAHHFLARYRAHGANAKALTIAPEAMALLEAYDWPGNIRQLENAVFRAAVLCESDTLTPADFPQIRADLELGLAALDPRSPANAHRGMARAPEATREGPVGTPGGIVRALDERGEIRRLAEIEDELIRMAVERYQGQMSEVARRLGIGRSTLYRRLKEMGIDPDAPRRPVNT